ncbi:MAG: glycosyltransferase, partial [Lachnospiraceae bacterium]
MKVIQINTVVGSGSVGRITVGLYDTAVANQLQARVCYGRRQAPAAMGAHAYKNCHVFDCVSHVLRNFVIGDSGFGSVRATGRLLHFLEEEQADVIHLHNIHGFYLHVGMLFAYLKKKQVPVVWTLHDCWAMTGHCAYFDYVHCDKWKKGCFSCPQHRTSYPYALLRDNSLHNYAEKKAAFTGMPHLTIVTPSHWLAELVRQSYLKEYPEKVIYNGIDTEVFAPSAPILESAGACVDNSSARTHSYTVLGVANIWEKRKGLSYFEALAVSLPDDYHIIVVGVDPRQSRLLQKKEKQGILPKGKITAITRTDNMTALAELYRQADVYVNPTLE